MLCAKCYVENATCNIENATWKILRTTRGQKMLRATYKMLRATMAQFCEALGHFCLFFDSVWDISCRGVQLFIHFFLRSIFFFFDSVLRGETFSPKEKVTLLFFDSVLRCETFAQHASQKSSALGHFRFEGNEIQQKASSSTSCLQ